MKGITLTLSLLSCLCFCNGVLAQVSPPEDQDTPKLDWCKYDEVEIDGSIYCCQEWHPGHTSCWDSEPGLLPGDPNFGCGHGNLGKTKVLNNIYFHREECFGTTCSGATSSIYEAIDITRFVQVCSANEEGFYWKPTCSSTREEKAQCKVEIQSCSRTVCGRVFNYNAEIPIVSVKVEETDTCAEEGITLGQKSLSELADSARSREEPYLSNQGNYSSQFGAGNNFEDECLLLSFE